MTVGVRLVVTGVGADGRSTVVSDGAVPERELPTGRVLNELWSAEDVLPAGSPPGAPGLFPGAGAARFWIFTVRGGEDAAAAAVFHRTDTIDLGFVVAGEIALHLEDGTVTYLQTGDAYVQNGTQHAWGNRGAVAASVALVVLGVAPTA